MVVSIDVSKIFVIVKSLGLECLTNAYITLTSYLSFNYLRLIYIWTWELGNKSAKIPKNMENLEKKMLNILYDIHIRV